MLEERQRLLREGSVFREPWVEATPTYERRQSIADLGLPGVVASLLEKFAASKLGVFDPPYVHQAQALESFFVDRKDLVVASGTGSGKTEIFLHSILGELALEGARHRSSNVRGVRALVLYPMNALVADQLARIRKMLGDPIASALLSRAFGRTVQFGMYTGRTPYHGVKDPDKDARNLQVPMRFYLDLLTNPKRAAERDALAARGRIPAKDLVRFAQPRHRADRYWTQPGDRELLTRQEMLDPSNKHGGTPDLLITNYSMLQYMLLRPIEQRIFEDTRHWLDVDPENRLLLVLDEAHLYRGAQGAEVALLIKRLLQRLGVGRDRIRCIITSASLGPRANAINAGPRFGAELAGGEPTDYRLVTSTLKLYQVKTGPLRPDLAAPLSAVGGDASSSSIEAVRLLLGWPVLEADEPLSIYLGKHLPQSPEFKILYDSLAANPRPLGELAAALFPEAPRPVAEEATLNLLLLATNARTESSLALMPSRVHLFSRGLFPQYLCTNSTCSARRANTGIEFMGRMFNGPRDWCDCGSRTFELFTHRTCGSAYLRAYRRRRGRTNYPVFLWGSAPDSVEFEEIHVLLEPPRKDKIPGENDSLFDRSALYFLDPSTGFLTEDNPQGDRLAVWVPQEPPSDPRFPWTWRQCPACGIEENLRDGRSKVSDLETKGEQPFANLVQAVFTTQPPSNPDPRLSNQGRKVLCFSDSRQKAARLARDVQFAVQLDSLREMFVLISRHLPGDFSLGQLFPQFVVECERLNISFFDDRDATLSTAGTGYPGSRERLLTARETLLSGVKTYGAKSVEDAAANVDVCRDLNELRPAQFGSLLLRHLGDVNYSLEATLVAYVRVRTRIVNDLATRIPSISRDFLEEILYVVVHNALDKRAFDKSLTDLQRKDSRSSRPGRGWSRREEGLGGDELLPDHLFPEIEARIGAVAAMELQSLLKRTISDAAVFVPRGTRWFLNPEAVTLHVDFDRAWFRCSGCHQFAAAGLAGKCPRPACGGRLDQVDPRDVHLVARRDLFRNPCRQVYEGRSNPFTIRSEEHSAQVSNRDPEDVFSKAEEYELLFQDILLEEKEGRQAIDVLSCTTTMEVGVDIGSLTAVALRTMPPRPDNYQQRSGRAGRRGASISTILAFADNSPYESYVFENPKVLVGAEPSEPIIYINNEKIAKRHIHASLFQLFFQRPVPGAVASSRFRSNPDLFASLGTVGEFFGPKTEYSYDTFREWLQVELTGPTPDITRICDLLPPGLPSSRTGLGWRPDFVRNTAHDLLIRLEEMRGRARTSPEFADANLLSTLLDSSVLPSFSFPTNLCKFTVQEVDPRSGRIRTAFEPQADMMQALSQYVPGREVVIDKRTFVPYGISIDYPSNLVDHAATEPWNLLPLVGLCRGCGTVVRDESHPGSPLPGSCPVCSFALTHLPMYRPQGFAPEYVDVSVREDVDSDEERTRATGAKLPLPVAATAAPPPIDPAWRKVRAIHLNDEPLIVLNLGDRHQQGFWVCSLCGALSSEGPVNVPHNRPYPRHPQVHLRNQCRGTSIQTALGFSFRTDLAVVRVPMDHTFDLTQFSENTALAAAGISLVEALGLATARILGIDSSELSGGYRVMPIGPGDELGMAANLDFFFYDTTPGGAGFAAAAIAHLSEILTAAKQILSSCDCSASCQRCLRTYDNRFDHLRLDRFLAASLLEYMEVGAIPPVTRTRQAAFFEALAKSVRLLGSFGPSLSATSSGAGGRLTRAGRSVEIAITSALIGGNQVQVDSSSGADLARVSEFVLIRDLPRAATTIFDHLA
ncbi:MAG: DEAD/DEAH box helicase [Thermoplasmata archaeon]